MFRLLKLVVLVGGLGAVLWFGATVRLGERTLFEHLQAIWKTHESQELMRGTKDKMGNLVDRATGRVVQEVAKNAPDQVTAHRAPGAQDKAASPMEDVEAKDRKALRGLIEEQRAP